jgi:hypothetical protein
MGGPGGRYDSENIGGAAMKHERSRQIADCRGPDDGAGTAAGLDLSPWLAPHIFILEIAGLGPPVYRLAGSAIQDFVSANPRGEEFYRYWDADAKPVLASYFERSAECGLAFRLSSTGLTSKTGAAEFESVIIPVRDCDARKRRFIGISLAAAERPAGTRPQGGLQHLRHIAFVHEAAAQGKKAALHLVHSRSFSSP